MNEITIGTMIEYTSAMGTVRAEVINMRIAPAADGSMQPWLSLFFQHPETKKPASSTICGSDQCLKMFKVKIIGRM